MSATVAVAAQSSLPACARTLTSLSSPPAFFHHRLWNGQSNPNDKNGCCTTPLVREATCATSLRSLCSATSPAQTRYLKYAFSPGGCQGDPSNLVSPLQDIANFLLVRGPYALLGHGWLGCSREYQVPEQINWDYGVPNGRECGGGQRR